MAKRKKKVQRKRQAAKSRTGSLANLSTADLAREMQRRQGALSRLESKRDRLLEQAAALDAEILALGGAMGGLTASGGIRKRPRNDANLIESMAAVLKGQTMSVTEVAEAVQGAGYRTTSPNFRTIVNQQLIKSPKFKRVSRGQYTAK